MTNGGSTVVDNKALVSNEIAELLDLPDFTTSRGGTVKRPFVAAVASRLGLPTYGVGKVALFRACLEAVGETWDPDYASLETKSQGGGNITLTALRVLRDAIAAGTAEPPPEPPEPGEPDLPPPPPFDDATALLAELDESAEQDGAFEPADVADAREMTVRSIVLRRGQAAFRDGLLARFGRRCAMTGCDAVAALEAAHIVPYRGAATNDLDNGLLLRADLHTLFDLGLVAVDDALRIVVAPQLEDTMYGSLSGRPLGRCVDGSAPSSAAFAWHRQWCGL